MNGDSVYNMDLWRWSDNSEIICFKVFLFCLFRWCYVIHDRVVSLYIFNDVWQLLPVRLWEKEDQEPSDERHHSEDDDRHRWWCFPSLEKVWNNVDLYFILANISHTCHSIQKSINNLVKIGHIMLFLLIAKLTNYTFWYMYLANEILLTVDSFNQSKADTLHCSYFLTSAISSSIYNYSKPTSMLIWGAITPPNRAQKAHAPIPMFLQNSTNICLNHAINTSINNNTHDVNNFHVILNIFLKKIKRYQTTVKSAWDWSLSLNHRNLSS